MLHSFTMIDITNDDKQYFSLPVVEFPWNFKHLSDLNSQNAISLLRRFIAYIKQIKNTLFGCSLQIFVSGGNVEFWDFLHLTEQCKNTQISNNQTKHNIKERSLWHQGQQSDRE